MVLVGPWPTGTNMDSGIWPDPGHLHSLHWLLKPWISAQTLTATGPWTQRRSPTAARAQILSSLPTLHDSISHSDQHSPLDTKWPQTLGILEALVATWAMGVNTDPGCHRLRHGHWQQLRPRCHPGPEWQAACQHQPVPHSLCFLRTASYHHTWTIPSLFLSCLTTVYLLIIMVPDRWALVRHVDASGTLFCENPGWSMGVFACLSCMASGALWIYNILSV